VAASLSIWLIVWKRSKATSLALAPERSLKRNEYDRNTYSGFNQCGRFRSGRNTALLLNYRGFTSIERRLEVLEQDVNECSKLLDVQDTRLTLLEKQK
jgi:hypothetical protein